MEVLFLHNSALDEECSSMTKQASNFIGSIPQHYDRSLGPRIFYEFADDLAGRVAELTAGFYL